MSKSIDSLLKKLEKDKAKVVAALKSQHAKLLKQVTGILLEADTINKQIISLSGKSAVGKGAGKPTKAKARKVGKRGKVTTREAIKRSLPATLSALESKVSKLRGVKTGKNSITVELSKMKNDKLVTNKDGTWSNA